MDIGKRVLEIENELIDLRRRIHSHPELRLEEYETTALIEEELKKYGIRTERYGLKTGVVGILEGREKGRTIAVRADIDGLKLGEDSGLDFSSVNPGVCHACGHDIHTTALLGCARVLSEIKHEIKGTVKFIFQPAEEGLSGARMMIEAGVLENPKVEAIIAAHTWPEIPGGTIGVRKGAFMASGDTFRITVKGRGGHAAHPHKSIDPTVICSYILLQLQTIVSREIAPLDSGVITVGKIEAGAVANIIPSEAVMEGTVRTLNPKTRKYIQERIEKMAVLSAQSMNGEAEVEYNIGVPPVMNDSNIVDIISQAVKETLGEDKLVQLENPSMGSEDLAFYLDNVPGAMFRIGTVNDIAASQFPLHNPKIIFDEKSIAAGAITMSSAVLKFLNS